MRWLKRFGWFLLIIVIAWLVYAQFGMQFRMSDTRAKEIFDRAGVEITIATLDVNGFPLHYAKTGNDSLPTLFFVHGSPGGWIKFSRYLRDPDLLKKFRMFSIDRPGYGHSNYGEVTSLQKQSDIISALLRIIPNGKPIYAAGRSFGGPMIAKLAIDNPDYFSALVFIASALDPHAEKPERWRKPMSAFPLKYFLPGAWKQSNVELIQLKKELYPLAGAYTSIHCPVYFLHGDKDNLVPVSNVDFARTHMVNAASMYVKIIPGGNHFISENHYSIVKEVLMNLY